MAISRSKKEEILAQLIDSFAKTKSAVFAENTGLTVGDISKFRSELRSKDPEAKYQIAKKTLIKMAAQKNNLPEIQDNLFDGSIGIIFSPNDELLPAQVAHKFSKANNKLVVKGGIFFGEIMDASKVTALANIPSKEELLAKLLGTMQAPITNFAGIGNSIISSFVRACSEIAKQKS